MTTTNDACSVALEGLNRTRGPVTQDKHVRHQSDGRLAAALVIINVGLLRRVRVGPWSAFLLWLQ